MPKALINSEPLIEHITIILGLNPSKVSMEKDRIVFTRGKKNVHIISCRTDNLPNQKIEVRFVSDKWMQALNYLCSISETPIFLELLHRGGGMTLTETSIIY